MFSWPVWPFLCVKDVLKHQAGLYLIDTLPTLSITLIFLVLLSRKFLVGYFASRQVKTSSKFKQLKLGWLFPICNSN